MTRKAVIVAAGLSSRLYPLTIDTPKPLLTIGDETMLARSIRLLRAAGISEIAVVVGFRPDSIREAVGGSATLVPNPFYRHCNNMGSLMMARAFAGDSPFLYLHGDLVYGEDMLRGFVEATAQPNGSCLDLLTAFGQVDDEAMKVRTDDRRRLIESSKSIPLSEASGEWTGISAVQNAALVFGAIEKYMMTVSLTDYDTAAFTALASSGHEVRCIGASDDPWKEIDTVEDLEEARAAFGERR
ncbi:MAG: phosphocholine cytidylyltransferase family protein [Gemmatimonadales bacterium]